MVHRPAAGPGLKLEPKEESMSAAAPILVVRPRWLRGVLFGSFVGIFAAAAPGCSDDLSLMAKSDAAAAMNPDAATALDAPADGALEPSCSADSAPVDPTALIDDFEDMTSTAPFIAGRLGDWYSSGDATPNSIMQPRGLAPPEPIPGGRCGSRRALHVTGTGFKDWGSQVRLALNYGPDSAGVQGNRAYDGAARGYQGVTFFARLGATSNNTVRFAMADRYSQPEAGLCVVNGSTQDNCYDTFGVWLTQDLTTSWKAFRIPFTGLSQQGFGLTGPTLAVDALYDVGFTFPPNAIFDLWVDDIRFY
jgi:hypothetical protein